MASPAMCIAQPPRGSTATNSAKLDPNLKPCGRVNPSTYVLSQSKKNMEMSSIGTKNSHICLETSINPSITTYDHVDHRIGPRAHHIAMST